jgi:hypothetical protein
MIAGWHRLPRFSSTRRIQHVRLLRFVVIILLSVAAYGATPTRVLDSISAIAVGSWRRVREHQVLRTCARASKVTRRVSSMPLDPSVACHHVWSLVCRLAVHFHAGIRRHATKINRNERSPAVSLSRIRGVSNHHPKKSSLRSVVV